MELFHPDRLPIRIVVSDDLRRTRLTVFFRLLLVIPHLIVVVLWSVAAALVAFVAWLAVLFEGRVPGTLHNFMASFLRYSTHVFAYLYLAADPYPAFSGSPGYPIDLEIGPPVQQGRWGAAFRIVLALPALLIASAFGGGRIGAGTPGRTEGAFAYTGGVAMTAALLAWFVCLARGSSPRGLRDLVVYALGYSAQAYGYALLLTPRYPNSDPSLVEPEVDLPPHPVRIVADGGLERSRLTVLFRLPLAVPHFVWLALWGVAALLAWIAAWFATLVRGSLPASLHRFLAAYLRYATHVYAFVTVVAGPFPGFTGQPGSYPIDLEIDEPQRQGRWRVAFRLLLAFPAVMLGSALGAALLLVAVLQWFAAIVTGRTTAGLSSLGAVCLRYSAQTSAYLLLLTERYPYSAPVLRGRPQDAQLELELPPLGDPV